MLEVGSILIALWILSVIVVLYCLLFDCADMPEDVELAESLRELDQRATIQTREGERIRVRD